MCHRYTSERDPREVETDPRTLDFKGALDDHDQIYPSLLIYLSTRYQAHVVDLDPLLGFQPLVSAYCKKGNDRME